tara:strand:- start:4161 stop:4613 length:453 start_codon:yes stop_codon:yes gene_type:complete
MLAMFEKLINEHGSSIILKERLQLFSDKYSMLEEKNRHISERNEELESKLKAALEEIIELKAEVALNESSKNSQKMHENEVKILKCLFDSNNELQAIQFSQHFSIPVGNIEYHLQNLLENELVVDYWNTMSEPTYGISSGGRKYVVESGI